MTVRRLQCKASSKRWCVASPLLPAASSHHSRLLACATRVRGLAQKRKSSRRLRWFPRSSPALPCWPERTRVACSSPGAGRAAASGRGLLRTALQSCAGPRASRVMTLTGGAGEGCERSAPRRGARRERRQGKLVLTAELCARVQFATPAAEPVELLPHDGTCVSLLLLRACRCPVPSSAPGALLALAARGKQGRADGLRVRCRTPCRAGA